MFGFRRTRDRVTGYPTSSNRASSFHLSWRFPPGTPPLTAVAASLEIVDPPMVDELYFWALQASFTERGRRFGGAHLGLQWYPAHPGNTAVNWGGYAPNGQILAGSDSALPSAPGNENTRDFTWQPNRGYELRIERVATGWRGSVDGVAVRDLYATGDALTDVVMWSEVFARCDAPSVAAQWSALRGFTADGTVVTPDAVVTNYQSVADGGCSNTDSSAAGPPGTFVQRTNTTRTTPGGAFMRAG